MDVAAFKETVVRLSVGSVSEKKIPKGLFYYLVPVPPN